MHAQRCYRHCGALNEWQMPLLVAALKVHLLSYSQLDVMLPPGGVIAAASVCMVGAQPWHLTWYTCTWLDVLCCLCAKQPTRTALPTPASHRHADLQQLCHLLTHASPTPSSPSGWAHSSVVVRAHLIDSDHRQRTHAINTASPTCLQGTRRYGSEDAEPIDWIVPPGMSDGSGRMSNPGLSEMFAYHATTMANTIGTSLVVFTRKVGSQRAMKSGSHQTGGHAQAVVN